MARRVRVPETEITEDAERALAWRYGRFTRPLAMDDQDQAHAILRKIAQERQRLDRTKLTLAERVDALAAYVADLGYAGIARRAIESDPPAVTAMIAYQLGGEDGP